MTKLTKEDVLRVAQLAHLELSDIEVEKYARQLDGILSYVDKLGELNTDGVEPMAHPASQMVSSGDALPGSGAELSTPLREDIHVQSEVIGDVLAGAPDPDPPYFRVPKVIER